jgi:hypothetical protein
LDDLKILADKALDIAEENGGREMRQSFHNDCDLYLVLSEDWGVIYDTGGKDFSILEINIDPYTGKVNKIIKSP